MIQFILSLISIYLMWNIFTFKYDGFKSIIIIVAITFVGILTGYNMLISVTCLAGILVGLMMVIKNIVHNITKFFHKGVR